MLAIYCVLNFSVHELTDIKEREIQQEVSHNSIICCCEIHVHIFPVTHMSGTTTRLNSKGSLCIPVTFFVAV